MGRATFVADDAMREKVRFWAAIGVPQDNIAKLIDCDPKTLRKHFRDELDRGMAEANAEIANCLYESAKGGNVAAQIFWMKVRAQWRECRAPEDPNQGAGVGSASAVVLLPDNYRDPELTEELRKTQERYFAKKQRGQRHNETDK